MATIQNHPYGIIPPHLPRIARAIGSTDVVTVDFNPLPKVRKENREP
jgi:hypothetical protein